VSIAGKALPVHALKTYRSSGIAPLIHNLDIRAPAALLPGKDPSAYSIGGWVNTEASLDVLGKRKIPCPNVIQTPVLQARVQLHYSFSRPSKQITECYTTLDHNTEYFGNSSVA